MDSQQNFPLNPASDQNQSNLSPNANNMGPAPFPPASFGVSQPPASPSQFPKSVNEAFNVPAQPTSFNQSTMPVSQPFSPVVSTVPVPPPPSSSPDIGIRTMRSDEESLRMTGGAEATPQVFAGVPAGPDEPVFTPDVVNLSGGKPESPKKSSKWLIIILVGLLFIAGSVLIFKYLLLPRMCPTPVCDPCPVVTEPIVTEPLPEEIVEQVPIRTHTSYLTVPADQLETVQPETLSITSIKESLNQVPAEKIKPSSLTEVVFADLGGPITFLTYMNTVFPGDFPESDLSVSFEEDFTAFVYYDASSKPFPGFIAKMKTGLADDAAKSLGAKFETSKNFANLFLTETGNFGEFDDGSIDAKKLLRFARGSNSQRMEYGFFKSSEGDTYWVATTSYNAIKEAVERLGI
jgi:hypothetical protein